MAPPTVNDASDELAGAMDKLSVSKQNGSVSKKTSKPRKRKVIWGNNWEDFEFHHKVPNSFKEQFLDTVAKCRGKFLSRRGSRALGSRSVISAIEQNETSIFPDLDTPEARALQHLFIEDKGDKVFLYVDSVVREVRVAQLVLDAAVEFIEKQGFRDHYCKELKFVQELHSICDSDGNYPTIEIGFLDWNTSRRGKIQSKRTALYSLEAHFGIEVLNIVDNANDDFHLLDYHFDEDRLWVLISYFKPKVNFKGKTPETIYSAHAVFNYCQVCHSSGHMNGDCEKT
ncbi:hypothetical protein DICA4_E02322 [Diutina catenulata]